MRVRSRWAILVAALGAGCSDGAPPRPQATVLLDTDAPVPRMMDRLQIDVLGARFTPLCPTCSRVLAVDDKTQWPLSFGVQPPDDGGAAYVRARLYAAGRTILGEPDPATTIDVVARIGFDGVERQSMFLPLDCAGRPADLAGAMTCVSGATPSAGIARAAVPDAVPSRVGTWHRDFAHGCAGTARANSTLLDGEACIAGGVFWMGDYRVTGVAGSSATPEHAVALSPFYVDTYEFTIGRYRSLLAAGYVAVRPPITGGPNGVKSCTWIPGAPDPRTESFPLNCLTADEARRICDFDGGRRLPTEAEWEWASGSGEHEYLYPGADVPPRSFNGVLAATGSNPEDRTPEGVYDLLGNLSELVADAFDLYTGPCWSPGGYGPDPQCTPDKAADHTLQSVRGSYYFLSGAHAFPERTVNLADVPADAAGFRCARDAK
jgi:formylglycine-generating enzyme required for sulfatase activity